MIYELLKQLKDAGFPQDKYGDSYYENGKYISNPDVETKEPDCFVPTLSELIEACGERFVKLQQIGSGGDWWFACDDADENDGCILKKGSTPEEAVAKLWLELNKK